MPNPFEYRANARRWLSSEVGERIRSAREAGGWTQQEVADETSISRAHLANLESGRGFVPSLDVLYEIAASLNVDAKELLP